MLRKIAIASATGPESPCSRVEDRVGILRLLGGGMIQLERRR